MHRDTGLDTLLEMDGYILDQGEGYWIKIEAKRLANPTSERPHGISYSLTLHDPYNQRILGYDNAHAVQQAGNKSYSGRRVEYDHKHRSIKDKGEPYEFVSAYQLLEDFFTEVDSVLKKHRGY
ncbi:DUF6516 family protein [Thiohalophilus sp.]|uniref:toxin-antitoxin system TumE family protein n=1 Tax=Thiohalophilus sp. TaxID=3028392 RepID=UPI0039748B01